METVAFLSMPFKVFRFILICIISLLLKWLLIEKICFLNLHPIQCLVPRKCSDISQNAEKKCKARIGVNIRKHDYIKTQLKSENNSLEKQPISHIWCKCYSTLLPITNDNDFDSVTVCLLVSILLKLKS